MTDKEKRMLIVDAEVAKKIDENRGDMSYSEFINYLIDSQLHKQSTEISEKDNYATKDDLRHLEQSLKEVLRSFLEFFLSYGLELGKPPTAKEFAELDRRLQALGGSATSKP